MTKQYAFFVCLFFVCLLLRKMAQSKKESLQVRLIGTQVQVIPLIPVCCENRKK